jgi:hypothetical protein
MARKKASKNGKMPLSRKVAFGFLLLAFAVFSTISIGTVALPDFSCGMFDKAGSQYYVWIPKNVSDYFAGERVNLRFTLPYGNTLDVYGTVSDGAISPLKCGAPSEHDYSVSMTWHEALALTGSSQPIRDFARMWDDAKIIVVPNGAANTDKLQAARKSLLNADGEPVPRSVQEQFDKYRGESIPPARPDIRSGNFTG